MEIHTISFVVGTVLLGAAIIGGGIEIKEIKIPKITGIARITSALIGLVFVGVGLWTGGFLTSEEADKVGGSIKTIDPHELQPKVERKDVKKDEINIKSITYIIRQSLGKSGSEVEKESMLNVYIDGKQVANLLVNSESPSSSISVKIDKPGEYRYTIDGYTVWSTNPDLRIPVSGSGIIKIDNGSSFEPWAVSVFPPTAQTQDWIIELRKY